MLAGIIGHENRFFEAHHNHSSLCLPESIQPVEKIVTPVCFQPG